MEIYPDTVVYVFSPAGVWTGGPNCCHQLCHALRQNGINAFMVYYPTDEFTGPKRHPNADIYDNPEAESVDDAPDNIVIVPESATLLLPQYKRARKVIYWLSVYYYHLSLYAFCNKNKNPDEHYWLFLNPDSVMHLADCQYAKEHLALFSVRPDRVLMQESYINKNLLALRERMPKVRKRNIVTFNPAKDAAASARIMEYYARHSSVYAKFVPLYDLPLTELADTYAKAKLHIDFGPFPGREFIPREASVFDMCVITGRRGASNYHGDVPIPEEYKFYLDDGTLPAITRMIESCLLDYDRRAPDFAEYKAFSLDLERRCYEQAKQNFIKVNYTAS